MIKMKYTIYNGTYLVSRDVHFDAFQAWTNTVISDYNLIQNVSKQIDGYVRFNIAASNITLTKQDIV